MAKRSRKRDRSGRSQDSHTDKKPTLYDEYKELTPFVDAYSEALKHRRNPNREYKHVESLYHDLQDVPALK